MFGDIDRSLKPQKTSVFLCKPNMETIAKIVDNYDTSLVTRLADLNEISFSIPYYVDIRGERRKTPYIDKILERFLLKVKRGAEEQFFMITEIGDNGEDDEEVKEIKAWSLGYELRDKRIVGYNKVGVVAREAMEDVLKETLWSIGDNLKDSTHYFNTMGSEGGSGGRSFEFTATVLDAVQQIAKAFNAVIVWDTKNRIIDFEIPENIGEDRGLRFSYGKYLQSIGRESNTDEMVTRLTPTGKDGLSIRRYNPTGSPYIEDFGYFMFPYEEDESGNVVSHSNYMTDSLCHAILEYKKLISQNEGSFSQLLNDKNNKEESITLVSNQYSEKNIQLLKIEDSIIAMKAGGTYKVHEDSGTGVFSDWLKPDFYYAVIAYADNSATFTMSGNSETVNDNWTLLGKLHEDAPVQNESGLGAPQETLDFTINYSATSNTDIKIEIVEITEDEYNGQYTVKEIVNGELVDKTIYITNEEIVDEYCRDKVERELEDLQSDYESRESEISAINEQLEDLKEVLKVENNFTPEQLAERNYYIIEKEWSDDNITEAGTLYEEAKKRFEDMRKPQIIINIDIVNFLKVVGEQKNWNKLRNGDTVTIEYERLGIEVKAKIIGIDENLDDDDISLTIANVKDIETDEDKLINMLYGAVSTSTTVDMNKFKWNLVNKHDSDLNDIMNSPWDATKRAIIGGTNESVEISRRGLMIKNPDDPDKYLIANHAVLAITRSGGKVWEHAITTDGIIGERIIGKILAGQNLIIENESGTFKVDANGMTVSGMSLTITSPDGSEASFEDKLSDVEQRAKDWSKQYTDDLKTTVSGEIEDLQNAVGDTESYIETTFKDGIIDSSEKLAIAEHLKQLTSEKEDLDKRYITVYANASLFDEVGDTAKSNLLNKKGVYDTRHSELVNAINSAIDDEAVIDNERTNVESKFTAYHTAIGQLSDAFEKAINNIAKHKANTAEQNAKDFATGVKNELSDEIDQLNTALGDFETEVTGTFYDGIIQEAEAKSIEKYKNTLASEKADIDNRYANIYNNAYLVDDATNKQKATLASAKTNFDSKYTALLNSITTAIADSKTTTAEKSAVDTAFGNYKTSIATLIDAFEKAIDIIAVRKAKEAEANANSYTDGEINTINDTIDGLSEDLQGQLDEFSSDTKITHSEAKILDLTYAELNNESTALKTMATSLSITTEVTAYNSALSSLNTAISLFIGKPANTYPLDINSTQRNTIKTSVQNVQNAKSVLVNKISAVQLEKANKYTDDAKTAILADLDDVDGKVDNLQDYVDTSFHDGVIQEVEAKAIEKYINQLNNEKADVDKRYTSVYGNSYLKDSNKKTDLYNKKTAYDTAHTNLINAINTAISDGSTTTTEKSDVDSKFSSYSTALSNLSLSFENAIDNISTNKLNEAKDYSAYGSIYVRGTGLNRNTNRILRINDKDYYSTSTRGLTLTVISRNNMSVTFNQNYDIYGLASDRDALATKLNSLSDDVIVVLASYDAMETTPALEEAIERCGGTGTHFGGANHRIPYALVGIPKIGHGAGIEVFTSDASDAPYAEISTKVVNGIPQGIDVTRRVLYENALVEAGNAQESADTANSLLSDLANDNKLTAVEKQSTKSQWEAIQAEKPLIDGQAQAFGIDTVDATTNTEYEKYIQAYNSLNTYVSPLLSNLSTTSDIVGSAFRSKFSDYFTAKIDFLNAVSKVAKSLADTAQERAESASQEVAEARDFFQKSSWKYEGSWSFGTFATKTFTFSSIPKKYHNNMELRVLASDLEGGLEFWINGNSIGYISKPDMYHGWSELKINSSFLKENEDNVLTSTVRSSSDGGTIYAVEVAFDSQGYAEQQSQAGKDAWGKFSGSGNTLPAGNVEFNFAGSSSKGGNANNTDNVGNQTASTVQSATINFNSRNDRISTTPRNPVVGATVGGTPVDAVQHTKNTDGSLNISFEWDFDDTGNAGDIDGFIVYIHQDKTTAKYSFGTGDEQVFYVTPDRKAVILYGVPADMNYTFGVQSYRIVDEDIDSSGAKRSAIIKSTDPTEDPYIPNENVEFGGAITGTIRQEDGSNVPVAEVAGKAMNSLQEGSKYNEVVISAGMGLVATRSDKKARAWLNGTNGIAIQKNYASSGEEWRNVLYADINGQLMARGLKILADDGATALIDGTTKTIDFSKFSTIVGKLSASNITVGSGTSFGTGYDPSTKETPQGAQEKADGAKTDAIDFVSTTTGNLLENTTLTGTIDRWKDGTSPTVDTQDFFGQVVPVQLIRGTGNYQIISKEILVDPSKSYEVTLWFKSDGLNGTDYFGLYAYDENDVNIGVDLINTGGSSVESASTNPYFWSGDNSSTWTKRTAYIMPTGTPLSDFKNLGENVSKSARMLPKTKKIKIRWLNYYNSEVKSTWVANPKMVEIGSNWKSITDSQITNADATLRSNLNLTEPVDNNTIEINSQGITAYQLSGSTRTGNYARLDYRGLYVYGGAIEIDGGLPVAQLAPETKDKIDEGVNALTLIDTNKTTWDKANTALQQASNYNGVRIDNTGLKVTSGTRTLMMNASDGIIIANNGDSLFYLDSNGNLNIKGNITMTNGSISWSMIAPPTAEQVGAKPASYVPSYSELTGTKPPTNADNTSTVVGDRLSKVDTNGNYTGTLDYTKISGTKPPSQADITFNALTADGRIKGFYMGGDGNLYINADYIKTGYLRGVTIDVDTDITVGNNVYIGSQSGTHPLKMLKFSNGATVSNPANSDDLKLSAEMIYIGYGSVYNEYGDDATSHKFIGTSLDLSGLSSINWGSHAPNTTATFG